MTLTKVHTDLIEGDLGGGASEELQVDTFTGDGTTVTFGLTRLPDHGNNTQVYISGVYQEKSTYVVSGLDLTFSEAPAVGESIEAVVAYVNPMYSGDHVKKSGDTMTGDLIVPNLNVANGITFGSGTDALDDYEVGEWVPTLDALTTSPTNVVYDPSNTAQYVKIGKMVTLWALITATVTGGAGAVLIKGLPFSMSTNSVQNPVGSIQINTHSEEIANVSTTLQMNPVILIPTEMRIRTTRTTSAGQNNLEIQDFSYIRLSISFLTD